ncbi:single-stranded DNA-binding protein 3-like isoform X2 [Artemia franciscana]|uniref:LisH domain-containing protein n=1 Tax=Artemia franciscana TaxID=6661 RepID=A0AA88ITV9_ARTSF|nr:hypothetical protein QYM36_007453 [Artemia franciscana]
MYTKGKGSTVPSDAQAREKLALYVYEYLLHVGAQKAAQTFLSEIRWEKNITLGEPPGFLHSWWCVFWDLYCAAPERRETCEHSSEAKAFHDYSSGPVPSPLGQMPSSENMSGGPLPHGFFPNPGMRPSPPTHPVSQPSPHGQGPPTPQMMPGPQFMNPRYPGGPRPGVRMPQLGPDFNGPGQQMMPNTLDPARQGPPMGVLGPRLGGPRGPGMMGPVPYGPGMRGPGPGMPGGLGPGMGPGGPMPIGMGPGGPRPQWQPNSSTGPPVSGGPPGPGTPIMQSPQQDSSGSGGEGMYGMMKSVPGGPMPGEFPINSGPDGNPMSGPMGPSGLNSVMNGNDGMDGMKQSPANGTPGTPREDAGGGGSLSDYSLGGFGGPGENDQTESAAILKIKESMQEEAKRFETDSDHPDYFMQ